MPDRELPPPSPALYFSGMGLHATVLFVRKWFGRRAALALLDMHRHVAKRYLGAGPVISVRENEDPESLMAQARGAALLRLRVLDEIEKELRSPKA